MTQTNDQTYEINVKRFMQTTEYQLKKLAECIARLKEYKEYEDWKNVKQAHLNASQIIKRIRFDIKEIEKLRSQSGFVRSKVNSLEIRPSSQLAKKIDQELKDITRRLKHETEEFDSLGAPYHQFVHKHHRIAIESSLGGENIFEMQLQKNEHLARDTELCSSYEQLQKDCQDLKYTMDTFADELFKQKTTIDQIEKNALGTKSHAEKCSSNLKVAVTYKAMSSATSGALLGSLVAGPVGMVAGAKIGAVFGLGGTFFGYLIGKLFGRKETK